MTMKNWGCPDWRDRGAYPSSVSGLKDWQWKWEFLRRHFVYRGIWEAYSENPEKYPHFLIGWCRTMWDISEIIDPRTALENSPFNSLTKSGPFHLPKDQVMEYYLALPSEERFDALVSDLVEGGLITNHPETEVMQYAIFDCTQPRGPQIDRVDRILKERQSALRAEAKQKRADFKPHRAHLTRAARSNWIRHLRVLDANDQDATTREIWEVLKTEQIMSSDHSPAPDTEELEDLLDREIYSESRSHHVSPTVKGWLTNAKQAADKVSRLLLVD